MDKLISVIIPTFNRKNLTDEAIESVVSSFPQLIEIIVIDDCGSIPYTYEANSNKSGINTQVIRLPNNEGAGMARKAGVAISQGEYIAFLDSDDRYDAFWLDHVIAMLKSSEKNNRRLMISGIVNGGRPVGKFVRKFLSKMPSSMHLMMSRVVAMIFNPFYTPSIVAHKSLCEFKDSLRYCEDYYSTATSLFRANILLLPNTISCHLGRPPNSQGGLSSAGSKMHQGEIEVRRSMLAMKNIPIAYKTLIPIGILYQLSRVFIKKSAKILVENFKQ